MKKIRVKVVEKLDDVVNGFDLWAKPTLIPDLDAKLVNVYIVKPDSTGAMDKIRHRMWVHDLLDDHNIPYHIEIKSFNPSKNKTIESQWIYVEEKHGLIVKALLTQYVDPGSLSYSEEEMGDEDIENISEDGIPQKKCTSCGENVDFDFYKCPYCKASLS